MSNRNWILFVEDILESIGLIEQYIASSSYDEFQHDRKTIDAVIRNLEIIGEAAKFIPVDVKQAYSEIDWLAIIGLRNRIAHEYFGISPTIIWQIIKVELPTFKKQIEKISKQENT